MFGFLASIIYLYIFTFHKYVIDNVIDKVNSKNKIFSILYPEVDAILIVLGYVFVSIIDISYMLTIEK